MAEDRLEMTASSCECAHRTRCFFASDLSLSPSSSEPLPQRSLLRDFKETRAAVNACWSGFRESVSKRDFTLGIKYAIRSTAAVREECPDLEEARHAGCKPTESEVLETMLQYLPLADLSYRAGEEILPTAAAQLRYEVVYCFSSPGLSRPAFLLLANRETHRVVVSVRGTRSLGDVLTDLTGVVAEFKAPGAPAAYVHGGIGAAADWLSERLGDSLEYFTQQGYEVVFTGHSLGAAVATLACIRAHDQLPGVLCYAFEPPACTDLNLAGSVDYVVNR
eukprot:TRINITY_DN13162_c0_g1_i1.p1 TRINITY_DN13162_c0_g1~~TRINITY_DN13162_c0_g1_i1.p1  ORF type:complete len:278 (+),score=26.93 TRINITY_DN13162_c0_g1_i1:148-981(+)